MGEAMSGLLDFLQSASNTAASNVSGPVDGLAWLLRKAGVPVGDAPVGGSEWMQQKGLTRPVQQSGASLAGETVGLLAPMVAAAKAPQIAGGLLQMGENAMAPRTLNPETGAIVWHGSPHKFDKFDSSKIGTGEGAQAYGHGLYLAESKGVADEYASKLSKPIVDFTGKAPSDPMEIAIQQKLQSLAETTQTGSKADEIYKAFNSYLNPNLTRWNPKHPKANAYNGMAPVEGEQLERIIALRDAAKRLGRPDFGDSGSLYKVDLPDEVIAKMLDWDKPLSQQGKEIQALAKKYGVDEGYKGQALIDTIAESKMNGFRPDKAGASSQLQQAGIPGIRYLDGGSRGAGSGTSNYVIFPGNENLLTILERNGQPVGLLD